eukprot:EG_transcript_28390
MPLNPRCLLPSPAGGFANLLFPHFTPSQSLPTIGLGPPPIMVWATSPPAPGANGMCTLGSPTNILALRHIWLPPFQGNYLPRALGPPPAFMQLRWLSCSFKFPNAATSAPIFSVDTSFLLPTAAPRHFCM